jgi:protein-S-isoprenylcysteine O-methyltransferase Ste14
MTRRIFAVLRSAIIAPLFVSIWAWFLPRWFAGVRAFDNPRPAGWVVVAIGVALMLACVWEFAWRGLGTPAPFDPPRQLVVSGLYRYVRNPMYVGLLITVLGEAIVFPNLTRGLLIEAASLWVVASLFILAFEEPVLRSMFDGDYASYCQAVGRWIPRVTPWYAPPHLE